MKQRALRVCMVATYDLAEEGGVKKHAMHLATQLRLGGDHVDIIAPYSGREPLPAGTIGLRGVVNIPSNGSDNRMGIFNCPWRVWGLLRREPYDVVHVHEPAVPSLAWYAAWFAGAAARVATFHAFSENESASSRLARRLLVTQQLRLFDRGIAVSPAAARFAGVAWSRPLGLIPNGIDTRLFTPPSEPRRAGPLRLLFVGHWGNPRKGLPVLLEAFARLRAQGASATLDVVGSGPAGAERRMDGLTYLGPISDEVALARRYRDADVFIAPSTGMESFGIVLLEAMASGRPVVCSDIEGYRAVVPADGARLVPVADSQRLAEEIVRLGADETLRRRMGEANRRASLAFDWARLSARVRHEYLAALSEKHGTPLDRHPPGQAPNGSEDGSEEEVIESLAAQQS